MSVIKNWILTFLASLETDPIIWWFCEWSLWLLNGWFQVWYVYDLCMNHTMLIPHSQCWMIIMLLMNRNHRGLRHYWGLRVRGQHTKTTGRRGKTVGVSKKRWVWCPLSWDTVFWTSGSKFCLWFMFTYYFS